ncbi:hypothetical protein FO519_008429 [Halicephalobus sp. NKZ332]|nr:hypothetical protein FO519_008429 [Halicephalobus sp. NKZ332]
MAMVDEESPPLLDNEVHANGGSTYSRNSTNHHVPNGSTRDPIKDSSKVPPGSTALSNARGSVASAPRAYRPRLVSKDGNCLIQPIHLPHHYRNMYRLAMRNWFHLIIENSWRSILIIFGSGFVFSWLFFGLLYYLIVRFSGDIQNREHHRQCIANVHSFVSAFLFSLESQHTIGYGVRYMTEVCPPAFIVLCIQLIVGVLLQTMLAGIVVAKVLRPKKRKQEMRFSRIAVIGPIDEHDKRPALMIRLADIQHRLYLAESHVRLYMAVTRINAKGEKELIGVKDMNVGYDSGWDRVLLLWPVIIRHVIDEESPLYGMTPEIMRQADFELIMTVEGIVEATGMTFQARTSFLPNEIQWGHRFTPMVVLNNKSGKFEVDYSHFEMTERCEEFSSIIITETTDDEDDGQLNHKHFDHASIMMHNASGFV